MDNYKSGPCRILTSLVRVIGYRVTPRRPFIDGQWSGSGNTRVPGSVVGLPRGQ